MKVPDRQTLAGVLLFGLLALVAGCSTFERDWKGAVLNPPAAGGLEGAWEGKWVSAQNGHTGRLRCLLTREDGTNYHARFKAVYWKVFRASYAVGFTGESHDGSWHFQGAEILGWYAGGVYHYAGRISPTNFFSTYRCEYDHGTFELIRPPQR